MVATNPYHMAFGMRHAVVLLQRGNRDLRHRTQEGSDARTSRSTRRPNRASTRTRGRLPAPLANVSEAR
jgi:hypothetical protein